MPGWIITIIPSMNISIEPMCCVKINENLSQTMSNLVPEFWCCSHQYEIISRSFEKDIIKDFEVPQWKCNCEWVYNLNTHNDQYQSQLNDNWVKDINYFNDAQIRRLQSTVVENNII